MGDGTTIKWRRKPVLGLVADGEEIDVPDRAWREAHNVRYDKDSVKNAFGWTKFASAAAGDGTPVLWIGSQTDTQGLERVLIGTGARFYSLTASGALQQLTGGPYHADLDNRWQVANFANILFASNIGDTVQTLLPSSTTLSAVTEEGYFLTGDIIYAAAGGSSYVKGDVLTVPGETGDTAATVEVLTVSSGAVLTMKMVTRGKYAAKPTGTINLTGGTGTGCTMEPTDDEDNDRFGPGAPKARFLVEFKGHLLAACVISEGITDLQAIFGSNVDGSRFGFEDWLASDPTSESEFRDMPQGGAQIMGLLCCGDYVLVLKEDAGYLLSYTGLPFVYNETMLPAKVGGFAPFAAAVCDEKLVVFVSRNGLFSMDSGGNITEIGQRVATSFLADLIYGDRARTYAAAVRALKEFILPYSSNGAASGPFGRAMNWNWSKDAYATRDWPFTAVGEAHLPRATLADMKKMWDELKMPWVQATDMITWAGDVDGNVFVYGRPELSADGTNLTATLRSGRSAHGEPGRIKLVRGVYVEVSNLDGATPLYLDIGTSETPEGALTWTDKVEVTGSGRVDIEADGRYLAYRFTKTGGTFSIEAYGPDVVLLGEN